MKNITAVKLNNSINMYIDGRLHRKTFSSLELADKVFRAILEAKKNPTDEAIDTVLAYLNDTTRIARQNGLEYDLETGSIFLAGFSTPIPNLLVKTIEEYHENGYPLTAITNFWKLLMLNPDKRVRESAFKFITTHDFVLTDNGYMVVYKAVDYKQKQDNAFDEFISNQFFHVRKDWKCSPNKYVVYRKLTDEKDVHGELFITKVETYEGWDDEAEGIEYLGFLGDLYMEIGTTDNTETIYTDNYTHSMTIRLGVPVVMDRKDCNSDPQQDCSYGLHCGATKYVQTYASNCSAVLVCLVNPAHIVAVPSSDSSKFRTSQYYPFAKATYCDGKIDIIEQPYFESDYVEYEQKEMEELVVNIKNNELPLEIAMNAPKDERSLNELQKIIESRLVDLSTL